MAATRPVTADDAAADSTLPSPPSGPAPEPNWEARVEEGKGIIEKVSKLKYEMARDRALQCVCFCFCVKSEY